MNRRKFNKNIIRGLSLPIIPFSEIMNTTMVDNKAKVLKEGDTIGLIAPGSPIPPERYKKAIENIKSLGLKVKYTDRSKAIHGYLAGTDKERLDDLHQMFVDSEVDGIWCLRGGYGCTRLLPKINYELIKKNPKVLIGYSDVTALLLSIYQKTGLIGFHGPAAVSEFTPYTVEQIRNTIMSHRKEYVIPLSSANEKEEDADYHSKVLIHGEAEGKLIGGNLSLLAAMSGTKYLPSFKKKIVFIEDIGEKPYAIDRMFTQLLQASDISKASAFLLGVFKNCKAPENSYSLKLEDTLLDRLGNLGIPLIYGFPFGHIANQCTFPIGVNASLKTNELELLVRNFAVE